MIMKPPAVTVKPPPDALDRSKYHHGVMCYYDPRGQNFIQYSDPGVKIYDVSVSITTFKSNGQLLLF